MTIPIIGKKQELPPPLLLAKCSRCSRAILTKPGPVTDADYRPAAARLLRKIGCNCKFIEPHLFIIDLPWIAAAGPFAVYETMASTAVSIGVEKMETQEDETCLDS